MKRDLNCIKDFYITIYPEDELGLEISSKITFEDLFNALLSHKDVYDVIGVGDSIIRERLFSVLADMFTDGNYRRIDNLWMSRHS